MSLNKFCFFKNCDEWEPYFFPQQKHSFCGLSENHIKWNQIQTKRKVVCLSAHPNIITASLSAQPSQAAVYLPWLYSPCLSKKYPFFLQLSSHGTSCFSFSGEYGKLLHCQTLLVAFPSSRSVPELNQIQLLHLNCNSRRLHEHNHKTELTEQIRILLSNPHSNTFLQIPIAKIQQTVLQTDHIQEAFRKGFLALMN